MQAYSEELAADRTDDLLQEAIRRRAYRLWEEEGRPEGHQLEHWVRAEREMLARAWLLIH